MENLEINVSQTQTEKLPTISLREKMSIVSSGGGWRYAEHIGPDWKEQLHNKRVLNIGAGRDDLQAMVATQGVISQVTSLDLKYPGFKTPENAVGGDAAVLPFESDSFDTVLSAESMSRWLPLSKQGPALAEAVRVLKPEGKIFVFEWKNGLDKVFNPNDVRQAVKYAKMQHPNFVAEFHKDKKVLEITKKETLQPKYDENLGAEQMLDMIQNEQLKRLANDLCKLMLSDSDTLTKFNFSEMNSLFGILTESSTGADVQKLSGFSDEDIKTVKQVIINIMDVAGLIGPNSRAAKARDKVFGIVFANDSGGVKPILDKEVYDLRQNFDPNSVSTVDRMQALQEACLFENDSWFRTNKEILEDLRLNDKTVYDLALTLREPLILSKDESNVELIKKHQKDKENILQLGTKLVSEAKNGDETARKRLEQIRVLGYQYQTDPVAKLFLKAHDPSIYGVAEFFAASGVSSLPKSIERHLMKIRKDEYGWRWHKEEENRVIQGRELRFTDRNDAGPLEFMEKILEVVKWDDSRLKMEQWVSFKNCPSCVGGLEGMKSQQALQQLITDEVVTNTNESLEETRESFAQSLYKLMFATTQ